MCIPDELSNENRQNLRFSDENREILEQIFRDPPPLDIPWSDILELLNGCDGIVREYGDRVCVAMRCGQVIRRGVFNRRPNQRFADLNTVEDIRYFLITVGIEPR
jgi:hypothetical protein